MYSYDLGDAVTIPATVVDPITLMPADATAAFTLTKPDGTAGTFGAIQHPATGSYNVTTTAVDQLGVWTWKWSFSGAVTDVQPGQFTVADLQLYVTRAELKAHLQIPASDVTQDGLIVKAIASSARAIEQWCGGRQFFLANAATSRIYVPSGDYELFIDDVGTLAGLGVETGSGGVWTTLPASSYEPSPTTAIARGYPVTSLLDVNYTGVWWAGGVAPRVRVTARWGWPEIRDEISQANLIHAARLFRRQGTPEGVAGFNDLGVVRLSRIDPDVQALLAPYRRMAVA